MSLAMLRKSKIWFVVGIALVLAISMELVLARNHGAQSKDLLPIIIDSTLKCATGLFLSSVFFACRYVIKIEWLGMIVGSLSVLALAMPVLSGYEALSDLILGANHPSVQHLSMIVGLSAPFGVRLAAPFWAKQEHRRTKAS